MSNTPETSTREHVFVIISDEYDMRCLNCDCRFGGRWHSLPCGSTEEDYEAYIARRG
jgi:hypothetical protein